MKSILLHIQDDDSLDSRLQTALSLTRATGGHLSCLHVTPIEAYVAFDTFGGAFIMQDVVTTLNEHETDLRGRIEDHLRKEDVSWDYQQLTGVIANTIISRSALADVIITGREFHRESRVVAPVSLLGDLLQRSRTPLLIAPPGGKPLDPSAVAVIAWDGGYEAANAVRGALGLLELASQVQIVQIQEKPEKMYPATLLLEYLSRHGIHADLRVESAQDEYVPAAILSCALQIDAAYLVMGGYGRSRISEYVFGGVTRSFLKECPLPIVVAH